MAKNLGNSVDMDTMQGIMLSELPDDGLPADMSAVSDEEPEEDITEPEDETDEIEPDEVDEDSEEESDDEPEDEEEVPANKQKKPLPKAEAKLVALKRENQRLQQQLREKELADQKQHEAKQQSDLVTKYQSQGYDEDTATNMAERDIRINRIEDRQAVMDFREENFDVLRKYPLAKTEATKIMANCKATGLSVEQMCLAMYGTAEPASDRRAREAAMGITSESKSAKDFSVSAATRTVGNNQSVTNLTRKDQENKRYLETTFRDGKPMSNKEYIAKKQQFGF